ncbi:MAG: hypothetical protein K2I58_00100 [Candidatus Amulumruptor sp.]|nr:hypothetical protein [Candidatus Amulumruptor sp.]
MLTTKSEFERRLKEINLYFDALAPLDDCSCFIESQTINGETKRTPIDSELNKILKANGFILMYNLLEATIRNTIRAIGDKISDEGLKYQDFSDNLKRLWINHTFKDSDKQTDKHKFISPILHKIVNNEFLKFEEESVSISGNIDAKKVREIAKRIGYKEPKDGADLLVIKEKRNQLAHGEKTFGEIGRDISVKQLIEMKNAMMSFIEEVLDNVQEYIDNKNYCQPVG